MATWPTRGQKAPNYWDDDLKLYVDEADETAQTAADGAQTDATAALAELEGRLSEVALVATIAAEVGDGIVIDPNEAAGPIEMVGTAGTNGRRIRFAPINIATSDKSAQLELVPGANTPLTEITSQILFYNMSDGVNYERAEISWYNTEFIFAVSKVGTGVLRSWRFEHGGTPVLHIDTSSRFIVAGALHIGNADTKIERLAAGVLQTAQFRGTDDIRARAGAASQVVIGSVGGSPGVYFGTAFTDSIFVSNATLNSSGPIRPKQYATGSRPTATSAGAGAVAYDTTLSKPIWSDGTVWRDSAGTAV